MKRRILPVLFALLLTGATACTHLEDYRDIARQKGMSGEYMDALNRWTRSKVIYSQFETQAHISATYHGPDFNRAYLEEHSRIYPLREEDRRKREGASRGAASDVAEFLFYAAIPEKASNDFDRRGSIWTIFLVNGKGERIDPREVRKIEPVTPLITKFYPYVNPYYGMAYRLRFRPLSAEEADSLKLVITGVLGRAELTFGQR
ncbi:MAG: hypothetical protein AB1558_11645 [Thermodesulfobacteriota bacterium]